MSQYSVIGKDITRVDGLEKVLGKTLYAGDLSMPGMLFGKALLSERTAARIVKVDVEAARSLEGVVDVITGKDVPGLGRFGVIAQDQPVLVAEGGEVRFTGDALAVVAAVSERVAERAIGLIKVEYEDLPGLYTIDDALSPAARRLHADIPGNICLAVEQCLGEPEKAFAQADVIVEETFETPMQEHAYIETEAGLAYVDARGCVNLYSCIQDPYHMLNDLARSLGLPNNRVRVAGTPLGGGFGAKLDLTLQHWIALLAMRTRRPVKMMFTREESFRIHPKRHPMRIRMKLGASRDGKLLAMSASVLADAGAYTGRSPTVLRINQLTLPGPYALKHIHLEGKAVFTNNPVTAAFRGYGAPQAVLAREAAMDLLARDLGMDPVEFRLKNCATGGEEIVNKFLKFDSPISLPVVAQKAMEAAGPLPVATSPNELVGRGIALDMPTFDVGIFPGIGLTGVGATVEMFQDGSVTVYSNAAEMGQGVTTVLAQIAAEILGLEPGDITLVLTDSNAAPKAGPSSASRQTYVSGNAVLLAAGKVRERLLERASKELEIDARDLDLRGGRVAPVDRSGPGIALARIAALCYNDGVNLREESWFRASHGGLQGHAFMASLADVAVDVTTGKVTVLRLVCAHDCGRAINPISVLGQLHGGAVQAEGYALTENMLCESGEVRTESLAEYLIPTSLDVPPDLVGVIVEEPNPSGPFGARGLGEHILNSVPPAILNAVSRATGAKLTRLPVHPEHVLRSVG